MKPGYTGMITWNHVIPGVITWNHVIPGWLQETTSYRDAVMCHIGAALQWHHNERDGVYNHWRIDCLFNRLFMHRSKKTTKLRVTGLYDRDPPMDSPHKGPATWKRFSFDDVIMVICYVFGGWMLFVSWLTRWMVDERKNEWVSRQNHCMDCLVDVICCILYITMTS